MDDDIVRRMLAEKADLEQKLAAVNQFLAAYGAPVAAKPRAFGRHVRVEARVDKFGPYGNQVVEAVLPILSGADGAPIPTRVLLEHLEQLGVEVRGANKINSLSALLARSSKIKGHGRAGWTLSEPKPQNTLADTQEAPKENEPPKGGSDSARSLW